ncbi:MAG: portal protein [Alphaproteobacteria bacterium]|nr:portal protein [Rhodospirillales bacterium]MCW9045803.1 portal protein [Alphaproteobacteria bacterium]
MKDIDPKKIIEGYRRAVAKRETWESHWRECYDYVLPQRGGFDNQSAPGSKKTDKLFDGTAPDAADQLAASLLARLTPPWSRWFGLTGGPEIEPEERDAISGKLEKATLTLKSQFDRSNFAVEIHQCYLDLIIAGTACLLVEESAPGEPSALRFTAVPLSQVAFEEGPSGKLDITYRCTEMTLVQLKGRFSDAKIPEDIIKRAEDNQQTKFNVIEAVHPGKGGYNYVALLEDDAGFSGEPIVLKKGKFRSSPFINFRWLKAPGEVYGRSPIMKALPDIKTANKVVELVLKNASISVTGIWQADDDGVLNPANIKLSPGAIIPKAVGSSGLTPLEAPGKFDVSQLVLNELRENIRRALLADKLGQINAPRMTATEVIERTAEMARLLGATYGRLQVELLTPLVLRALSILSRRGEIQSLKVDGRLIDLQYNSPLARRQAQEEAEAALKWIEMVNSMGPEAVGVIDKPAAARWLGRAYGVPDELIKTVDDVAGNQMPDLSKITEIPGMENLLDVGKGVVGQMMGGGDEQVDG